MAAATGIAGTLERVGPVAGDAGGLVLLGWWMFGAIDGKLPGAVATLVWLLATVLVGGSLLGYQLRQLDDPAAWLGWTGMCVTLIGFVGNAWWVPAGLAIFGVSVIRSKAFPTLPGVLLATGGWLALVTTVASAGGASGSTPSAIAWRGAITVGLILVAGAFADLDALTGADATAGSRTAG
jgi:hypothetical protein